MSAGGLNATLLPATLVVSPGNPAIAILHMSAISSTRVGVYNVTITGSSNAGQHSTSIVLNVVSPPSPGPPFDLIGLIIVVGVSLVLAAGVVIYLHSRKSPVAVIDQ